jgi:nucleotide-binding universal stress UspA family protein
MYKKVMVPLDGSKLAEVALPHLETIARGCDAREIVLVSVTQRVKGQAAASGVHENVREHAGEIRDDRPPVKASTSAGNVIYSIATPGRQQVPMTLGRMARSAAIYLDEIGAQLEKKGLNATFSVLVGKPAEEIVRYAEEQGADLIVMASRGKSGISQWDTGNIASKVVKTAKMPVLLVKPGPDFKETKPKRRGVAL